MIKLRLLLISFVIPLGLISQNLQKSLKINHIENAPRIDGELNDSAWLNANNASDFVMFEPGSGTKEPKNQKSIIKVAYDDNAIYVGAYLFDDDPKSIPMQFSSRDNFAQADYFGISINPNNDGINDTYFIVMSSGSQADAKVSNADEDFSWSAVWQSAVSLADDGWVVEMKIPFAALRFSKENKEAWGVNFFRNIQRNKEKYTWNYIDKTKGNISEYSGLLEGISNVNPPIRLSFYPYSQGTVTRFESENTWQGTAGLDVKYGINESFTFDATLIPDFGQTAFDDVVVNLGPFEQQYEEKRAFFTEGTELFEKGDLFYSRRIGGTPMLFDDVEGTLSENESIGDNPEKTKMLNALKISGRSKKGFGLGIFNALINTTKATIIDIDTQKERTFLTNPFTNYSILVMDQQFNKTSSVSLINTNVLRKGSVYDANVTSVLADLRTNNNKYALKMDLSTSNLYENSEIKNGYRGEVYLGKVSGAHRYGTEISISDNTYDKNDLGYQDYNNYVNYEANYSYRIFKPKGKLNRINYYAWAYINYLYMPYTYADNGMGISMQFTTKKHLSYGTNVNVHFGHENDYYEPRVNGRFYKKRQVQFFNTWFSTDYNKKFALNSRLNLASQFGIDQPHYYYSFRVNPRFRFSNKFQMIYALNYEKRIDEKVYVNDTDGNIYFGNRKAKELVNSINGTFTLNTKMAISLSCRYYWAPLSYDPNFYLLQNDGNLTTSNYFDNHDENLNLWNFDFSYTWEFAPGSQLVALFRNELFNNNEHSQITFSENLNDMFKEPATNQLSLKLIYYLDYNKLRN